MLTLYEHPLSPYAQKCKIALREKGVDFDARLPVGIGSGQTADDTFARHSPRGEVPLLVDGETGSGTAIFDSKIILAYIEERWPEPPLLPADPAQRARVRMLEDVLDTQYEPINWGLGEIEFFGRATGELADRIRGAARAQVEVWHRYLTRQLGERAWFNGDAFGHADLCVVPYLNGSAGFDLGPKPGSKLGDWLARANERPTVAQTAAEAAAIVSDAATGMANVAEAVRQGLIRREYRDHRLEWMIRSGGLQVVLDGLEANNIRFNQEFDGA